MASLNRFMTDVGRIPLLTAAQEQNLARRMEAGDQNARGQLIEANLRFVIALSYRYSHRGLPLEDLIQEGSIGLIRAVERFDWRRGFRFSTYAGWCIRGALLRATVDRRQGSAAGSDISIGAEDLAGDAQHDSSFEWTRRMEDRAVVAKALASLQPREREVIQRRFGLVDDKTETLKEVGRRLELSHEGVRLIQEQTLRKLETVLLAAGNSDSPPP